MRCITHKHVGPLTKRDEFVSDKSWDVCLDRIPGSQERAESFRGAAPLTPPNISSPPTRRASQHHGAGNTISTAQRPVVAQHAARRERVSRGAGPPTCADPANYPRKNPKNRERPEEQSSNPADKRKTLPSRSSKKKAYVVLPESGAAAAPDAEHEEDHSSTSVPHSQSASDEVEELSGSLSVNSTAPQRDSPRRERELHAVGAAGGTARRADPFGDHRRQGDHVGSHANGHQHAPPPRRGTLPTTTHQRQVPQETTDAGVEVVPQTRTNLGTGIARVVGGGAPAQQPFLTDGFGRTPGRLSPQYPRGGAGGVPDNIVPPLNIASRRLRSLGREHAGSSASDLRFQLSDADRCGQTSVIPDAQSIP